MDVLGRLWFAFRMFRSRKIKKAMAANHCGICGRNYPVTPTYQKCLVCGEPLKYRQNERSMHPNDLTKLKSETKPASDALVEKIRVEAEHRFETMYEYAIREAGRRNIASPGRWRAEDILEELLDAQEQTA